MLQQLQLTVCPLREHGGAEGLHDLLDGDGLAGELVLGRAARTHAYRSATRLATYFSRTSIPYEAKGAHSDGLQVGVPVRSRSAARLQGEWHWSTANLLVISNVVPKIWARTNSAMLTAGAIAWG